MNRSFLALAALPLFSATAQAQDILPTVIASIHDEPVDGLGDTFNNAPFEGLLRKLSTRQDRAILEYDLSSFVGSTLPSVTLSGQVFVNNSFDNGLREFDFVVYSANGVADLTDFQITATLVGSGSYAPPSQSSFTFSFDVTAEVQAILDGGNGWIGVRCDPTSEPNFPNILDDETMLTIGSGGPGTAFCFGDGSGTQCPCGNSGAAGRGCANSATADGAVLLSSGSASISANDFTLLGGGLRANQPGLYFQGDNAVAGGNGVVFGDGLRCAGGNVARIQIVTASAAGNSATTASVPTAGGVSPGDLRRYQLWYRDPSIGPCGTSFNLTNGIEVVWQP